MESDYHTATLRAGSSIVPILPLINKQKAEVHGIHHEQNVSMPRLLKAKSLPNQDLWASFLIHWTQSYRVPLQHKVFSYTLYSTCALANPSRIPWGAQSAWHQMGITAK